MIWSRRSAGTLRSPRRRSASSAWALAMAASPPLTATYISSLQADAGGARQADYLAAAHEQQIDAAREQRTVVLPLLEEIMRQAGRRDRAGVLDARTAKGERRAVL